MVFGRKKFKKTEVSDEQEAKVIKKKLKRKPKEEVFEELDDDEDMDVELDEDEEEDEMLEELPEIEEPKHKPIKPKPKPKINIAVVNELPMERVRNFTDEEGNVTKIVTRDEALREILLLLKKVLEE